MGSTPAPAGTSPIHIHIHIEEQLTFTFTFTFTCRYVSRVEEQLEINLRSLRVVKLLVEIVFIAHLMACAWFATTYAHSHSHSHLMACAWLATTYTITQRVACVARCRLAVEMDAVAHRLRCTWPVWWWAGGSTRRTHVHIHIHIHRWLDTTDATTWIDVYDDGSAAGGPVGQQYLFSFWYCPTRAPHRAPPTLPVASFCLLSF